jgi:hypothetical protein
VEEVMDLSQDGVGGYYYYYYYYYEKWKEKRAE